MTGTSRKVLSPEEIERDRRIAERLGFTRPYISGPNAGKCPGTGEYGHGMTLTTVHGGSCRQVWEAAHGEIQARQEKEAGE